MSRSPAKLAHVQHIDRRIAALHIQVRSIRRRRASAPSPALRATLTRYLEDSEAELTTAEELAIALREPWQAEQVEDPVDW